MMKDPQITIIGCGNMGRSLIGGLISNGHPVKKIIGVDLEPDQRELTSNLFNISVMEDSQTAVREADVIVLAVKPQAIQDLLKSISPGLDLAKSLLVSIAAGIRLQDMENWCGGNPSIIRVMPNTPALINAGIAGMYANQGVTETQRSMAESILRSVGTVIWLDNESLLDTVTAVSGSGPAYFFLIMEVMEKAAHHLGLSHEHARNLVLQTALGSAKMALESNYDPAYLRRQVTSPGGTTEKALEVMIQSGIEQIFQDALSAAKQRAAELATEFSESSDDK